MRDAPRVTDTIHNFTQKVQYDYIISDKFR
jgi:hypothetical protein